MIDLAKIQYRVVVMDESKNQYNIKEYIENLGWEENDGELSVRTSFVAKNDKTSKGYLSKIIKPGCLVGVFATDGASQDEEVARGYVETWNPVEKSGGHTLKCTCYDELYKLQKSQDNRYFPSGTGTKSAIEGIFDDWEIPQGSYQGPNASHGKTVENNKYLSDIIINLLDDAAKKGEEQCFVQARKGKTSVIPRGSNKTVYVFRTDNTQMFSQSISTADMITRVKVVGRQTMMEEPVLNHGKRRDKDMVSVREFIREVKMKALRTPNLQHRKSWTTKEKSKRRLKYSLRTFRLSEKAT